MILSLKVITCCFAFVMFLWPFKTSHLFSQTYYLFPQANNYPYGIKPDCVDQEAMNQDCLQAYADFCKIEHPDQLIDLSMFPNGIYIISVSSKDFVRTEKIIKL